MAETKEIKVTEVNAAEGQMENAAETTTEVVQQNGLLDNPFVQGLVKVVKVALVVGAAALGLTIAEKIGEAIGEKKVAGLEDKSMDEIMDIVNEDDDQQKIEEV